VPNHWWHACYDACGRARPRPKFTAEDRAIATNIAPPRATGNERTATAATLRARIGGYVVDMVILSAIAMVAAVLGGLALLLSTDFAEQDATNADMYAFAATMGAGGVVMWTALNLILLATRRQTGGQYVAGLRLARIDGERLTLRSLLAWWFCLNPLLFSWPMAGLAGFSLLIVTALTNAQILLILATLVIILCVAAPVAAIVSALFDRDNRGLQDRVLGTIVVPA
jgi:hypothetical protein